MTQGPDLSLGRSTMQGMSNGPKGTPIIFTSDEWKKFSGPIVYIAWKGQEALYVGVTCRGLRRPMDPQHHAAEFIQLASHMEIYQFSSIDKAHAFEKEMIDDLQPIYNHVGVLRDSSYIQPQNNAPVVFKIIISMDFKKRIKARAVEEGRTMTSIVISALELYLSNPLDLVK